MERGSTLFFCLGFSFLLALSLACNGPSTPASPAPTATPTPTECVPLTHVPIPPNPDPNVWLTPTVTPCYVFRNLSDWDAYVGPATPVPTPPVDFSTTMIAAFSQRYPSCTDTVRITSVCYFSDHVEVHFDFRSRYKDAFCRDLTCSDVITNTPFTEAVAVPQSALPVSWIANVLCP